MERLTFEGNSCEIAKCEGEYRMTSECADGACSQRKVWERLKAYEDTGLEPEEIREVQAAMAPIPFGRFRDIMEAERAGRLVVLPCKVGDTVYRIDPGNYHSDWKPFVHPIEVDEISWKYAHTMKGKKDLGFAIIANGSRYKLSSICKTVFLTREEAERVLKGGQRHG